MSATVDDAIERVELHNFRGTPVVACALVLKGGHVVVGLSKEAKDINLATLHAREDAHRQVRELLAFHNSLTSA